MMCTKYCAGPGIQLGLNVCSSSLPKAEVSPTLTRVTEGTDALLTSSLGPQSQSAPGARQVPGTKKAVLGNSDPPQRNCLPGVAILCWKHAEKLFF